LHTSPKHNVKKSAIFVDYFVYSANVKIEFDKITVFYLLFSAKECNFAVTVLQQSYGKGKE